MDKKPKDDMAFFYPNRQLIKTVDKFIEIYSNVYYYFNRGDKAKAERVIEDILSRKRCLTKHDLGIILAWKTGNRYDSEKEAIVTNKSEKVIICMNQDWEDLMVTIEKWERAHEENGVKPFCMEEEQDCIQLLRSLIRPEIKGVGMVYAITVLYFLSKGRYPIYDQYACVALDAIAGKKDIDSIVNYCELSTSASIAFKNDYRDYFEKMQCFFGEKYTSRDVDRALWAYGHMFTINKIGRTLK